ncbi:hypothetical protein BC826DRAFT_918404 [Russula brevipes]|nr:hypothetical protein BC826DRAFT_918404 [Russula brevipes]
MPKRPADDANVETAFQAADINDDYWMKKLLEVDKDQLTLILSLIANKGNIDNRSIKKSRIELPSFSTAKWIDFARRADLPEDPSYLQLEHFDTPVYQLPPSFHKAIFENSWRAQDVYQELVVQTREESRVRILDPYIVPILSLFHGRVISKPEEAMPSSAFSTGGEVEHEVVMIGGILFLVIEARLDKPSSNNLAQLFLELLSAARVNKQADFEGLRVYGILTNLTRFAFYSYHPTSNMFCQDDEIFVEVLRDGFSSGMIHVLTNKIFGLVLFAFIDGLRAILEKSKQRATRGDVRGFALEQSAKEKRARKSTEGWELALRTAEECRLKFMETVTTIEDMEVRSTEALDLLTKSVRSIPRFSAYTTRHSSSCLTSAELKDLASQAVESTLRVSLSR